MVYHIQLQTISKNEMKIENNQALFRENARISYTSLYSNTSSHWIEAALREGLRSAH